MQRRVKYGYGVGHVLNDLCSAMWFTYLLIYFHHVLLFDNTLAGVVLLIGQVADALSTPFIGREADRTDDLPFCSRYGRRKTWHLVGTVLVLSAFPFIFLGCLGCMTESSQWAQVLYYAPFVIIFQFGWAATQISHLALIPSLTQDPNDRTELNAIRYGFTVMSNITVYVVTWLVLGLDASSSQSGVGPEDATKFRYIMVVVLAIGLVFASLFHILVKETNVCTFSGLTNQEEGLGEDQVDTSHPSDPQPDTSRLVQHQSSSSPFHYRMTATDWLKNTQFYQVALVYMSTRLFCNLSQAYVPIYLQDTLQLQEESVAYIPLVMYISGFLTTTIMRGLNRLVGRKVSFILGAVIGGSGCVGVFLGRGDLYVHYLLYLVSVLLGSGGSIMLITSLSITADLIGPNTESGAFVYGAMSFTDKLSNGVAVMLIQYLNPCVNCCPMCSGYYREVLFYACGGASLLAVLGILSLLPVKIGDRRKGNTEIQAEVEEGGETSTQHDPAGGVCEAAGVKNPSQDASMSTVACIGPPLSTLAAAGMVDTAHDTAHCPTTTLLDTATAAPGDKEYSAVPGMVRHRHPSSSDGD